MGRLTTFALGLLLVVVHCGGLVAVYSSDGGPDGPRPCDAGTLGDARATAPSDAGAEAAPPYGPTPSNTAPDDWAPVTHPPPPCPNSHPLCKPLPQ